MRILLLLALFALSGFAQATNYEGGDCRGNCGPKQSPDTQYEQDQDQGQAQGQNQAQAQGQNQGQAQGQSQSADATAVAGAIAGASADNYNSVRNSNEVGVAVGVGVNTSDYNKNSNESSNTNLNVAEGGRGGEGGKGGSAYQGQSQSSDNSNSSNNSSSQSTNITFEGTGKADHYNKYGNNVGAIAPNIYSSSACTAGGISGAASALGVGVSLGGAKQDVQCQVRENARILAGLDTGMAIDYLCKNDKVDIGAVLGAACKYTAPAPTQPIVPDPPVVVPPIVIDTQVKGR
jgi:hypothetical protein